MDQQTKTKVNEINHCFHNHSVLQDLLPDLKPSSLCNKCTHTARDSKQVHATTKESETSKILFFMDTECNKVASKYSAHQCGQTAVDSVHSPNAVYHLVHVRTQMLDCLASRQIYKMTLECFTAETKQLIQLLSNESNF